MPLHGKALESSLLYLFLVCFLWSDVVKCQSVGSSFPKTKSGIVGVYAAEFPSGKTLWEVNGDTPLKPASVLKLITSAAALSVLGTEHTFETRMFIDGKNLYIVGGGDPVFTTEDIFQGAKEVAFRGINSVSDIVIDLSRYPERLERLGLRAYEALPLALTFNFNSVRIWCCSTVGAHCAIGTDPPEIGLKVSAKISPSQGPILDVGPIENGGVSVRGTCSQEPFECQELYRSLPDPIDSFGKVFKALLAQQGVKVTGSVKVGPISSNAKLLFSHHSRPLRQIIDPLNHLSTNIIAEQLIFELGCQRGECSRNNGLRVVSEYLQRLGIKKDEFSLKDGSGLSQNNQLSAKAVVKVLTTALSDRDFGPEYRASLAIGSVAGTLKRRRISSAIRGKTGSIDGVSSIAGVIRGQSGKETVFAVLQNGVSDKVSANEWEEEILARLEKL